MIRLQNFTKIYGKGKHSIKAVQNMSFEVKQGSVTALLGPNGAGKTTLIKAICALHYATEGHVLISENNIDYIDAAEDPVHVKELVGYVPEIPILNEHVTVYEYLSSKCSLYNFTKEKTYSILQKLIKKYALEDVIPQKISSLSKGYRQRLSFAGALINDPPVLVLDEPSSGLDPVQIIQIRKCIKELSSKKTILLSTHLMQEVNALCKNVLIISHGKLKASGTAAEIAATENCKNLEAAFLKITGSENI